MEFDVSFLNDLLGCLTGPLEIYINELNISEVNFDECGCDCGGGDNGDEDNGGGSDPESPGVNRNCGLIGVGDSAPD